MDPLTTTLGKGAGKVVRKEAESFLTAALGEPAKALGGLLADKINARRYKNLIPITAEAHRRLADAGLTERQVPLKIIHPALEYASLEEDHDLGEPARKCG